MAEDKKPNQIIMEIYKKLFEVKAKIGKISKDSDNPFFKSKYFDVNALLENVEPLLHDNKLVLLQPILEGKVRTQIIDVETGEEVTSEMELPSLTDPQKLGSAITYYRRYTLQSLLGIQAEDDDANKASGNTAKESKKEPENWLNLFDKSGNKTASFTQLEKAISEGKKYSLQDIRKKYKVSKVVAEELKTNFNIQ